MSIGKKERKKERKKENIVTSYRAVSSHKKSVKLENKVQVYLIFQQVPSIFGGHT